MITSCRRSFCWRRVVTNAQLQKRHAGPAGPDGKIITCKVTLLHCSASMSTQSLEQQKVLYSRELAAYTLRQWTAARKTIDAQRLDACLSSAMRDISLGSPGPSSSTAREKKGSRRRTASLAGAPDRRESARAIKHDEAFKGSEIVR